MAAGVRGDRRTSVTVLERASKAVCQPVIQPARFFSPPKNRDVHCHGTRFCDFLRRTAARHRTQTRHDTARTRTREPRNRRAFGDFFFTTSGLAETTLSLVPHGECGSSVWSSSCVYLLRACNGAPSCRASPLARRGVSVLSDICSAKRIIRGRRATSANTHECRQANPSNKYTLYFRDLRDCRHTCLASRNEYRLCKFKTRFRIKCIVYVLNVYIRRPLCLLHF